MQQQKQQQQTHIQPPSTNLNLIPNFNFNFDSDSVTEFEFEFDQHHGHQEPSFNFNNSNSNFNFNFNFNSSPPWDFSSETIQHQTSPSPYDGQPLKQLVSSIETTPLIPSSPTEPLSPSPPTPPFEFDLSHLDSWEGNHFIDFVSLEGKVQVLPDKVEGDPLESLPSRNKADNPLKRKASEVTPLSKRPCLLDHPDQEPFPSLPSSSSPTSPLPLAQPSPVPSLSSEQKDWDESEGSEHDVEEEFSADIGGDSQAWANPTRPRPGLSLTIEEIEMVLNCYSYLLPIFKTKRKCCEEVGNALKIGMRKVTEVVNEREKLVKMGAPPDCVPLPRVDKKRGKPRQSVFQPMHVELIKRDMNRVRLQLNRFPKSSEIHALLKNLPPIGEPVVQFENLQSPGPLDVNLKTLKGLMTKLRKEID